MDLQFFGANCITVTYKGARVVIDDNLAELGAKSILKPDDIALFTGPHEATKARLVFDGPGEYEASDLSIIGIDARSHLAADASDHSTTMYKLMTSEFSLLITGHIHPDISDALLERIGMVDVLFVPVGGSGYTLDPLGALKVIKEIEPKLVIPTHTADKALNYPVPQIELETALKELAMEPRERVTKLRLKAGELSDITQLVVLEKS
jgi:L-ascorbate metabolism protein UlaG (beta-lactamase superfamily)